MDERDPPRLPLANVHVPLAEVTQEMVLVCGPLQTATIVAPATSRSSAP